MGFLSNIFGESPKEKYALALDIGTEFVKALVFRIDDIDTQRPKGVVLGTGKQRQRLGDMQSGAVTDIAGVVENCDIAMRRAEEMAGVRVDDVVVGIAGELVKGATTTVNYERLKPKIKVDLSELKNIINKVQWKAFDQVRQQLSWETGYSEIDVKLVNAAIVNVTIDGYHVTNPLGFQGKTVSVGIFNAFAPLVHLGALQSIASDLKLNLITVAAEPYAVSRSVGADEAQEFNAIFIDIGGGTTDIAVVRNGGVEGTKMFAIGGRSFTKRLSQVLNISFAEAEKIKLAYSKRKLIKKSEKVVREALFNDCKVWLSGIELALSEFSGIDLLPSKILLCGGGSALPEIKEVLSKDDWYKSLPFAKKPTVRFIQPKDVTHIKDETKMLTSVQDITPMALANLVLDIYSEEDMLSGILNKVVKLIGT